MSKSRCVFLTLAGTFVALGLAPLKLLADSATKVELAASAPMQLLTSNGCLGCHRIDSKLVGPAFNAVAEKYANRDDVIAYLSRKIRQGGSGTWGGAMMPPMGQLSDADVDEIARWLAQ